MSGLWHKLSVYQQNYKDCVFNSIQHILKNSTRTSLQFMEFFKVNEEKRKTCVNY